MAESLVPGHDYSIGQTTSDKFGFYGATPIVRQAGAAQATSLVGTASSTAIDTATKAALIAVMDFMTLIGLWKGAA